MHRVVCALGVAIDVMPDHTIGAHRNGTGAGNIDDLAGRAAHPGQVD
jgi:hypothetical protein